MKVESSSSVIIWIRDSPPPVDQPVILWNSYGFAHQHPETISLPLFIEENADLVRARLMSFLDQIAKKSLGPHGNAITEFAPSFGPSLWWMALSVFERLGDTTIPLGAKCVAVELLLDDRPRQSIVIESDDRHLRDLLYSCIVGDEKLLTKARRLLKNGVAHQFRALIALLNYVYCTTFQPSAMASDLRSRDRQLVFIDYLKNAYMDGGGGSIHSSSFWGVVPSLSDNHSFCHVFPTRLTRPKVRQSLIQLQHLTDNEQCQHVLFVNPLTLKDLALILSQYLKNLRCFSSRTRELRKILVGKSGLSLWSLLDEKWADSIIGSTAISHLVTMRVADSFASKLGEGSRVYYLMENQGWEFAMVHSVSHKTNATAIGVPHSTIRFWDVRYANSSEQEAGIDRSLLMPTPSRVLVNSMQARQALLTVGTSESSVKVVEAARYTYLQALTDVGTNTNGCVLILGDFLERANDYLLSIVKDALALTGHEVDVVLKPHPNCAFTSRQLGDLAKNVRADSLSLLFPKTRLVVTTAGSSTAAEAVAVGLPVVLVPDPSTLDYSPTLPAQTLARARNATELAFHIQAHFNSPRHSHNPIFILDPEFTRWRAEFSTQ